MIISPKRITLARWFDISSRPFTILRNLEYEIIRGLHLRGKSLDLGGGVKSRYPSQLRIDGILESVNFSEEMQPTYKADLNLPLPLQDCQFDNVISFNTFEHVKNDVVAIKEAFRVLRPQGEFHFMVPFLHRVHGSPYDFHRHTAEWWDETLAELGASSETLLVEPLGWEPVSCSFLMNEILRPGHAILNLRRRLAMLPGVLLHLRWRSQQRVPEGHGRSLASHALGYYLSGKKA